MSTQIQTRPIQTRPRSDARRWMVDGETLTATTSTSTRLDLYELGGAAMAAIELETEFPGVAVSARLRQANAGRRVAVGA